MTPEPREERKIFHKKELRPVNEKKKITIMERIGVPIVKFRSILDPLAEGMHIGSYQVRCRSLLYLAPGAGKRWPAWTLHGRLKAEASTIGGS